ncbi:MAG: Hsp70 family protein [Hyphomicrobiaceae bacterium]
MKRRGAIAGLDFGMTNSLLCTHDPESGPTPYTMKGADTWVVPTVVANTGAARWFERLAEALRGSFVIGWMARRTAGFAENFKIGLPRAGTLTEEERRQSTEFKAASIFLDTLFTKFFKETNHTHFETIVVTVPESWLSGAQLGGVNALKHILSSIGVQGPRILSEPIAAACYFSHRHAKTQGRPFDGHVLIYDHGGSTLDLCVARLGQGRVHAVTRVGRSGDEGSLGFGGVQFDNRVFERIAAENLRIAQLEGEPRARWLHDFEHMKRQSVDTIEKGCSRTAQPDIRDEPAFSLMESTTQVRHRDLLDVFEREFAPAIRDDVLAVLEQARRLDAIDISDPERFRVVTVGGFSEFPPVQRLLEDIFVAQGVPPEVLDSHFLSNSDRWLAVAKGACLVASGTANVTPTCPLTFGVMSYVRKTPHKVPLLELGNPIVDYEVVRYLDTRFELAELSSPEANAIEFFIDRAGTTIPLRMTSQFRETLPDFGKAKWWHLGCLLDEGTAVLLLKSNTGQERPIRMGNFMAMIEGQLEGAIRTAPN